MDTIQLPPDFWSNVDKKHPSGCWVWIGSRGIKGYGRYTYKNHFYLPHRVMYEMYHGPIPEGCVVMHSCDNPPCCNPDHLSIGTSGDNCRDRTRKGRTAKGSGHGRAILSESIVRKIRSEVVRTASGRVKRGELVRLAAKYGITRMAIHFALRGKSWNHVSNPAIPGPQRTGTPQLSQQIRDEYLDGKSRAALAREHGMSATVVFDILSGSHWTVKGKPDIRRT